MRGQRHLTREHLHIGQPAEWILEESRLAVVEDGHRHHVVVQLFDVRDVVGGKRELLQLAAEDRRRLFAFRHGDRLESSGSGGDPRISAEMIDEIGPLDYPAPIDIEARNNALG